MVYILFVTKAIHKILVKKLVCKLNTTKQYERHKKRIVSLSIRGGDSGQY